MADDPTTSSELGLSDDELVRILLDRRLLTTDRLLVAQRHAQEQNLDLLEAIRNLHLVDQQELIQSIKE